MRLAIVAALLLTGCGPEVLDGYFPVQLSKTTTTRACEGVGGDLKSAMVFQDGQMLPLAGDEKATCLTSYDSAGVMVEVICTRPAPGLTVSTFDLITQKPRDGKMFIAGGVMNAVGDLNGCTKMGYTISPLE